MIGVLGAKIWIENKVNFADSTNLLIAGVTLVVGISDMTFTVGDFTFNGIVNGTVIAVVGYQIMRGISRARGTSQE
jgi:NCS2 family nucleobase:cation symporter-2